MIFQKIINPPVGGTKRRKVKTEEMCSVKEIKFNAELLVPVIAQEYRTRKVLMLAYANPKAVSLTLKTGLATFWSRSRKRIWVKGEGSGNLLKVVSVLADCDRDALLYIVKLPQGGGACHETDKKGNFRRSCFYHRLVVAKK